MLTVASRVNATYTPHCQRTGHQPASAPSSASSHKAMIPWTRRRENRISSFSSQVISARLAFASAEHAAQNAAQDLATNGGAHRAHSRLGHGLRQAFSFATARPGAAKQYVVEPAQQATAFNWFVNAISPASGSQRWVLAAGDLPPADLPLRDDLRSRLGWGHVFQLQLLGEAERRAVLRQEAEARGVALGDEVMDYMLRRFSRDLGSLMQLLDHLDRYALQTQRAITIPLIKSMLENE